ncbi:MAG: AI-2E family transporter, partial [Succinivibrio sp.]
MISLFKKWYQRNFSVPGTVEFALVLIVSFLVVYYLMWLVGPLVVALCIAYCLDWIVRFLIDRCHFKRPLAAGVTVTAFVGIFIGIMVFFAPKILQQGSQFYHNLQIISAQTVKADSGEDFDGTIASKITEMVAKLPDPIPSMIDESQIKEMVAVSRSTLFASATKIIKTQIMPSVVNVMSWLMYFIIVPIFTFLMLANKPLLLGRFRDFILPHNREVIHVFWPKLNGQIEGYIRGKLIHITIITIVN